MSGGAVGLVLVAAEVGAVATAAACQDSDVVGAMLNVASSISIGAGRRYSSSR